MLASSSKSCAPVANISPLSDFDRSSDWSPLCSNNLLVDSILWGLVIGRDNSLESDGGGASRDLIHVYKRVPTRIVNTDVAR